MANPREETLVLSDTDFAASLIDEFLAQFSDNGDVDMTCWHLILPIAADAGIVVHENGDVDMLNLQEENGISTNLWEVRDDFERAMKEQVDNASSGQLAHYVAWAHSLMETS